MGLKYLYDTNIFIEFVIGDTPFSHLFKEDFILENEVITSQIVRIELLSYSKLTEENERDIENLLRQFDIVGITEETERETIALRKKYKLKLPDAIIAATAIVENAILVTKDVKDFRKVAGINIY